VLEAAGNVLDECIVFGHQGSGRSRVEWETRPQPRSEPLLQFIAFDADYLERLQRGDLHTERHFAAYFGQLIKLKLRSRLASMEAIEAVRQETFVRVLTLVRANEIRDPERLGALVNAVCNNVLLEHYRTRSRSASSIDEMPEAEFVATENTGAGAESREAQLLVRKILTDLPDRDRRLLQLVLLEERDKDAVCAELGLSREYLRVLVHRAKRSFKFSYVKRFGDAE
jgi:RNA polymerase sigma-70 factor (ECF subfamily)